MNCEICGAETHGTEVLIDSVKFIVCDKCSCHGRKVEKSDKRPTYRTFREKPGIRKIEVGRTVLAKDFGKIIMQARQKKDLTRKELAKKIFEKESYLHRLESQAATPSDSIIEKLEKMLEISLRQEIKEVEYEQKESTGKMTLGDFLKKK